MRYLILTVLKFYKYFISPLLGQHCRYYPTCSSYAMEAVSIHGSLFGSYLTLKRLLRCHPYHKGDIDDPVPPKTNN